jgi:signal transduction histidine kinase
MMQPGAVEQRTRWAAEVLRRASAVLHGRMVGVWEVGRDDELVPVAHNATDEQARDVTPQVHVAIRHMKMPHPPGTRWVAGRTSENGNWCVAPVRDRVPDPPPNALERRSRERLALELAGLCLGLSGHVASAEGAEAAEPALFQRFTEQIGTFAQDIAGPVAAARTAVARGSAMLSGAEQPGTATREQLLEELRAAARALEQTVSLVRTVQDRARAVVAEGGHFDLVQVVWSCVDGERAQAALRGATLELKTLAYVLPVPGNADELRTVVAAMLRGAVTSLQGRVGTVTVLVENVGPVVRLTVRSPALQTVDALTAALGEARRVVENSFGGTLTITSAAGEGTTLTVALPVPSHRFRDPALWWER